MIRETIKRIEKRIEKSGSIGDEARAELLGLVKELEAEVAEISEDAPPEQVESALGLAEASAHESARNGREAESPLKEQTFGALQTAVQELEASHPRLAEVIARMSHILSRMGI